MGIKRYKAQWSYSGQFSERHNVQVHSGQEIELESEVAEWVNRDRPGTLIEVVPDIPERPEGEHEPATIAKKPKKKSKKKKANRQITKAETREEDSDQEDTQE